jgi:hypothetical protein
MSNPARIVIVGEAAGAAAEVDALQRPSFTTAFAVFDAACTAGIECRWVRSEQIPTAR